jgi:hypothetical protein
MMFFTTLRCLYDDIAILASSCTNVSMFVDLKGQHSAGKRSTRTCSLSISWPGEAGENIWPLCVPHRLHALATQYRFAFC